MSRLNRVKSEIEGRIQAEFTVIYEKKGVLTCCRHFTNCGDIYSAGHMN